MRRSLLAVTLATIAALTAHDMADAAPLNSRWQVMERIARATWPNACQPEAYTSEPLLSRNTLAMASIGRVLRGPHKGKRRCHIAINPARKVQENLRSWATFCRTLVHEWGHLAGRSHVYHGEAEQVMFFSYTDKRWPGCGKHWTTHPARFMSAAAWARVRYCPNGVRYDVSRSREKACRPVPTGGIDGRPVESGQDTGAPGHVN